MEILIIVALVVLALAVTGVFCAVIFKALNIIHDITCAESVANNYVDKGE